MDAECVEVSAGPLNPSPSDPTQPTSPPVFQHLAEKSITSIIKNLILGILLFSGMGVVVADVKPPLETRIEVSTKGLMTGVKTDVNLLVWIPEADGSSTASIKLTLTESGSVNLLSNDEWTIENFIAGKTQQVPASFLLNGTGQGRLHLQAETFDAFGNRLWGRTDSVFFLVTENEILAGRSSWLGLKQKKLKIDRRNGVLSDSEYKLEIRKLLSGRELRFERKMRGLPEIVASPKAAIKVVVDKTIVSGRATYSQRINRKNGVNIFATKAKARGIPGVLVEFYHQPPGGGDWVPLDTTPPTVTADANGYYSAEVPGKVPKSQVATNLIVLLNAINSAARIGIPGILNNPADVHLFESAETLVAADTLQIDLHVDNSDPILLGAFSMLESAWVSFNYAKNMVASTGVGVAPQEISIQYPDSDPNDAHFTDDGGNHISMGLNLALDWDVFTHEYGHYIQEIHGTDESDGGSHKGQNLTGYTQDGSTTPLTKDQAIKLAWGEGWATYFGTSMQISAGAGTFNIYSAGDMVYTDTADDFHHDIEGNHRPLSKGEDNEHSVYRILWDFEDAPQDGHDNVIFGRDAMWKIFFGAPRPTTLEKFRKKVNMLTPRAGGGWYSSGVTEENRAKYGRIYFDHNVGPEPLLPLAGPLTSTPPTFKWKTKGAGDSPSYHFDTFNVHIWDGDFSRRFFSSKNIPIPEGELSPDKLTAQWTPSQADWDFITAKGGGLIHWAVSGSHDDGTTATGPYLGLDRTLGLPNIAFVIDNTGSMGGEIAGVKTALTRYVNKLKAMTPKVDPMIEVIVFSDFVYHEVLTSDLDKVQEAINRMSASGGGECPEASGEALTSAVLGMARGGRVIFATDASPHRNYSLNMAKMIALSKNIGITQIVTGDCKPDGSVTGALSHLEQNGISPTPLKKSIPRDSQNPGYKPPPGGMPKVKWLHSVDCETCPIGPGVGPYMTPNILKEVGDTSLPIASAVASYADLAAASPNFNFVYLPAVKDGDSEPFINAVLNSALAASGPTVTMVKPVEGHQGTNMNIEVLGGSTNFGTSSQLTIKGGGITINSVSAESASTLNANITVGAGAVTSARDVFVRTELGGGATELASGTGQFRVIAAAGNAKLISVSPAMIVRGEKYTLDLNGEKTHFSGGSTTVSMDEGISIDSITIVDPEHLKVEVSVAANAKLGFHDIKVETGAETAWLNETLVVVPTLGLPDGMPKILSVTPAEINQAGRNLKLTINGLKTHFINGLTSASISAPGVTVLSTTVLNSKTAQILVNVEAGTDLGFRDINLVTGAETAVKIAAVYVGPQIAAPPPEPSQNPCDDSYVKQATDELVIKVKPNGVDDTGNIQCALDWAVDTGMPQVRLSADTFYISSLVIEKFNGSLQGMTTDSTIISVLDDSIACNAMTSSGRSSAAIKFVMGEPRLRFMTVHAHRACQTNNPLQAIVRFTGAPAEVGVCRGDVVFGVVDRVILDGTSKATGPLAAVSVSPEVHASSGCKNRLLGTFKLNRSMLANTQFGLVSQMKSAAQVDVNFNNFIGNKSAIWLIDTNQSTTITSNEFFGGSTATDPYWGIMVASTADAPDATRVVVHKNRFNLSSETGKTSVGVFLQQPGKIVNVSSVITNNQFLINGAGTWGVYALDVSRVHVSANSFSGTPSGAIIVAGSTPVKGWSITANNCLKNLVSSTLRDIWLLSNTSNCIVGPGQGALINNLGTNNSILTHFSPSPTVFRNKVESVTPEKSDPAGGPIGDRSQYAEYVQAQQAKLQVSARAPGTQDTGSTAAMVEMLDTGPNPCNESFVSRDDDELVIKVTANGINDTENIQCALDWAVDTGMPVVKLSADKFFISSVSIEKFNGSLQGNTQNSTFIEVLDGSVACDSMTQSGRASAAIRFVKGEPRLRYMTIKAHRACKTSTRLGALIRFTGEPANPSLCTNDVVFGSVDRVGVDGTSVIDGPFVGVSVSPEASSCQGRLQGTFKLNRSFVAKTEFGVVTKMRSGAQVDINFNDFLSTQSAIWLIDTNQNTTITSNQFLGGSTAEKPFFGVMIASTPDAPTVSRLVVHNNLFNISSGGRTCVAVYQQNSGKVVNISSAITNNRFEIFGSTTWGIVATDVSKTHVSANRFSGTAVGAIQVGGTTPVTGWTITANYGFSNFTSTSTRDIWLRDNTSRCIVGPGQGVTINDLGSQNSILSLFSPAEILLQNTVKSNPAFWPGPKEISLESADP